MMPFPITRHIHVLFDIYVWKRSGVNQWRDQLKPSQMLQNLARLRGVPAPQIADDGSFLSFGGREYRLDELGILIKLLGLVLTTPLCT